jgi:hypothetical protein
MAESKRYRKTCPFCGTVCENFDYMNLFCKCNAKYYLFDKVWLNRNTGEQVFDEGEVILNDNM